MKEFYDLTESQLLDIYRNMVTSRKLDERMSILLRQGKAVFHMAAAGHEAAQVGAAMNFKGGHDWSYPYYRNMPYCLQLGMTPKEIMLDFFSKENGPCSGGRQMPHHWGHKELRILSQSSPTGTQMLQAVGSALGAVRDKDKAVVYVSLGEGTTSQGDFHEAMNWASREKLPVIFHIEDNGYAISVPKNEQMTDGSVLELSKGYPNFYREEIDGTDFFQAYSAFNNAVTHARKGKGPAFIVSNVVRLMPHSSSDDHRKYRDHDELEKEKDKDPIKKFKETCGIKKLINGNNFERINAEIDRSLEDVVEWALNQPFPDVTNVDKYLFVSPYSRKDKIEPPTSTGENVVLVDAINHALHEEMEHNDKMLVYGQDIADGKGGVFTATKGLSTKFGKSRAFNAPLAESSIIGTAVGLSSMGYKPVVEIQFSDYIWTSMMQIRNELATVHYRSNGKFSSPVVIRTPVGGYIHGGLCHSQCIEAFFAHIPGLNIAFPSNAADAKGLLKAAIRMDDPVLFLEHKGLYRQGFAARPEPDGDYILPFGHANRVMTGDDLTIVTWGILVYRCVEAVKALGISADIIDLRTIVPFDQKTVFDSVKKTGKAIVMHEDTLFGGFGAEVAAQISSDCFEYLDGPVRRLGAKDLPIAYHGSLEKEILPSPEGIKAAISDLYNY